MRLMNICKGQFKHHYGGTITVYVIMEEFMDSSYFNMIYMTKMGPPISGNRVKES